MKTIYFLLITAVIIITSFGCEKVLKDETLTLKKSEYTGNQLRIDGYYYANFGEAYSIFFLYRNGVVLNGGDVFENQIQVQEQSYTNGSFYASIKENKLYWGVFTIDSTCFQFEKWYPSSGGGLPVYLHKGIIQNDTTFIITKSIHSKTGEEHELNEVYHFKPFSPKPDSTNTFL